MSDYFDRLIQYCFSTDEDLTLKEIDVGDSLGRYWINPKGEVISFCNDEPLRRQEEDNGNGYKQYVLNGKKFYTHRLLASSFLINDNPKEKIEVHHIDFNKNNNSLDNLVWLTREKHSIIHTLMRRWNSMEHDI